MGKSKELKIKENYRFTKSLGAISKQVIKQLYMSTSYSDVSPLCQDLEDDPN